MESESGKREASIPRKTKSVDGSGEEYRATGASGGGAASSSTLKPTLSPTGDSCDTSPVTPSVFTEPPSPADARALDDPRSTTPYASSSAFDTPQSCSSKRGHFVGRTGEGDSRETHLEGASLRKNDVHRVNDDSFDKNEVLSRDAPLSENEVRLKDASLSKDEAGGGVRDSAMPACFQSFLFSDGESGSDPSDDASSDASASSVKTGQSRSGDKTGPGMSCPKSPPTLGSSSKDGLGHGGSIPTSPVPDKSALGSVPTVKVGRSRSGDRPRPGETSPASPTALGSCLRDQAGGGSQTAPVPDELGLGSVSAVKTGCSRSGDRPGFSGSGPASPAARDEVLVQDGVEASSSLHRHPLRAAVGSLKQGISKDEVAQEGREQTPPPPPPPVASSVPHPMGAVSSLNIVSSKSSEASQEGVEGKLPEASHEGGGPRLKRVPQEQSGEHRLPRTAPRKTPASGMTGDDVGAMERGRYLDNFPGGKLAAAAATAVSQDRGKTSIVKDQWKRWMENDDSSSDNASSHGKKEEKEEEEEEEEEEEPPLPVPPRPLLHPSRVNPVGIPKRSAEKSRKPGSPVFQHGKGTGGSVEKNRKPGSPVFQHGKGIRSIQRITVATPTAASPLRQAGSNTSRVTHRPLSPRSGAGPTRAVLGRRRSSRVSSSPGGGGALNREATAAEMIPTDAELSHEVAESGQPVRHEDTQPDEPGAGAGQGRRWLPRVSLPSEKAPAAKRAPGVSNSEQGGKFDMLASSASFSDSDGSSSEIDVCDFLEVSGSDVRSTSDDTGCRTPPGRCGAAGDVARAYLRGESGDLSDEGNPHGAHMGTLDEQEIAFLAESRELREALLGVEDLNFGMLPLIRQVELIRDLSTAHFSSGDVIFREGEPSDTLYISIDPTASVFQHDGNMLGRVESKGKAAASECEVAGSQEDDRTRASVPPGRIFGEHGLVYSAAYSRPATVRAAVNMSCAVLHAPAFPRWSEFRLCLLIKKVPLLADLSPVAQNLIIDSIDFQDFEPDELIVREGERAQAFFMITSGMVAVTRTIQDDAASASCSFGSCSSEGMPDTTPSTTDGDDSMSAFAGFVAQHSQSAPSTPETYGDFQRPDFTEITARDSARTHRVTADTPSTELIEGDASNTQEVEVGTRKGDDCIPHGVAGELTGGGASNLHLVAAESTRGSPYGVTADIAGADISNLHRVPADVTGGDASNTHGETSQIREGVPSNPHGDTVEGDEETSGGSHSSDPRNVSKGAGPMLDTTAPGSGVPNRGGVHGDTAVADEEILSPSNVDTDIRYQELKGPEPAVDDEPRLFPESNRSPSYTREIPLTRLYEGTFFGEMALIYDEPRNANVRAATKVNMYSRYVP